MKSITIYEFEDGEVACKYGNTEERMSGTIKMLTLNIEDKIFNIIENGKLEEAKKQLKGLLQSFN